MRKKWVIVVLAAVLAVMLTGAGSGFAVVYWTGDGLDDNWDTDSNWSSNDDGDSVDGGEVALRPVVSEVVIFNANSDPASLTTTNNLAALTGMTIQVDGDPGAAVSVNNTAAITIVAVTNNSAARNLTLSGTISLSAAGTFHVANASRRVIISSALGGAFALSKTGQGTLQLGGNDTYNGTTTVSAGTLIVNGTQAGAAGAYTVAVGATLGGTGTIGRVVTINGTFNPGDPLVGGGVGTFNTTGAFTFSAGSFYVVDVSAGASDQLNMTAGGPFTVGGTIGLGTVSGSLAQQYPVILTPAGIALFPTNNTGWVQSLAGAGGRNIELAGVAGQATPTLNEWGLILFAILIASFAIWGMRRKNYTTA